MSVRDLGEVHFIAIANLHEDEENPKIHTDAQVDMVASSIESFGFNDPVGVVSNPDRAVGGYLIVEGHGRVRAAKLLRMEEVPCIVLDHLSEQERRAYALAHNQCQQNTPLKAGIVAEEFDRLNVSPDDWNSLGYTDEDAMFLPAVIDGVAQVGWHETTEDGTLVSADRASYAKDTWKDYIPTVHRTTMRFSNDVAYQRYVHLLTVLRELHPTTGSVGERMGVLLDRLGVPRPQPKQEAA